VNVSALKMTIAPRSSRSTASGHRTLSPTASTASRARSERLRDLRAAGAGFTNHVPPLERIALEIIQRILIGELDPVDVLVSIGAYGAIIEGSKCGNGCSFV
jgi:hypothetical protein